MPVNSIRPATKADVWIVREEQRPDFAAFFNTLVPCVINSRRLMSHVPGYRDIVPAGGATSEGIGDHWSIGCLAMSESGQTRSFGDVRSMSGLPKSGREQTQH